MYKLRKRIKRVRVRRGRNMLAQPKGLSREERLMEARRLSDKFTQKTKDAGISRVELERDVHKAFLDVKRSHRTSRS